MMRVEIISRESIKPSFPTPQNLTTSSLLDQLIPVPYAPLLLFYPNYNGASHLRVLERLKALKQSLSATLTHFYPLAGSIYEEGLSIDCNDDGVYIAVAHVHCHLSDFLNHPDIYLIHGFLPSEPSFNGSSAGTHVTNIQVNIFGCSRIDFGLCISHRILDGAATGIFSERMDWSGLRVRRSCVPRFQCTFSLPHDLWLKDSTMVM